MRMSGWLVRGGVVLLVLTLFWPLVRAAYETSTTDANNGGLTNVLTATHSTSNTTDNGTAGISNRHLIAHNQQQGTADGRCGTRRESHDEHERFRSERAALSYENWWRQSDRTIAYNR
jgi:hypothetical protein